MQRQKTSLEQIVRMPLIMHTYLYKDILFVTAQAGQKCCFPLLKLLGVNYSGFTQIKVSTHKCKACFRYVVPRLTKRNDQQVHKNITRPYLILLFYTVYYCYYRYYRSRSSMYQFPFLFQNE